MLNFILLRPLNGDPKQNGFIQLLNTRQQLIIKGFKVK